MAMRLHRNTIYYQVKPFGIAREINSQSPQLVDIEHNDH